MFTFGAFAVSAALAGATYELTRSTLLEDRERSSVRAAFFDASLIRQGIGGRDPDLGQVLSRLDTGEARRPLIRRDGQWFAPTADDGLTRAVPVELLRLVEGGTPAVQRVELRTEPALVVGVPLPDGATYYEITALSELRRTLAVLATVLGLVALPTPFLASSFGWIFTEMGRQPWVVAPNANPSGVDGVWMLAARGVSTSVSPAMVIISIVSFTLLYAALAVVWGRLMVRYASHGASATEPDVSPDNKDASDDRPMSFAY